MRFLRKCRNQETSRLRVVGMRPLAVLIFAMIPTVLTVVVCQILTVGFDRMIGISGTVFAIATFVLSQFQASGPRHRRVVMVPKSRSPFSLSVYRGLADSLHSKSEISVSVDWPLAPVSDEVGWQLEVLRRASTVRADGVVIVPAADDDQIWEEIVRLTKLGLFVVVLDTKPRNAFFAQRNVLRPCFAGSNFRIGGELVGEKILEFLAENPDSGALVAMGPGYSFPGSERSRAIAEKLVVQESVSRTVFHELDSWDRRQIARQLVERLQSMLETLDRVVVFCGNDKILGALDRLIYSELAAQFHGRVSLIGYDGALGGDGGLLAGEYAHAIATVDTQPVEQGVRAARFVIDEHEGLLNGRGSSYVRPHLITFSEGH